MKRRTNIQNTGSLGKTLKTKKGDINMTVFILKIYYSTGGGFMIGGVYYSLEEAEHSAEHEFPDGYIDSYDIEEFMLGEPKLN
jgi:hypothetical protein